jgi:hypothetical protein
MKKNMFTIEEIIGYVLIAGLIACLIIPSFLHKEHKVQNQNTPLKKEIIVKTKPLPLPTQGVLPLHFHYITPPKPAYPLSYTARMVQDIKDGKSDWLVQEPLPKFTQQQLMLIRAVQINTPTSIFIKLNKANRCFMWGDEGYLFWHPSNPPIKPCVLFYERRNTTNLFYERGPVFFHWSFKNLHQGYETTTTRWNVKVLQFKWDEEDITLWFRKLPNRQSKPYLKL